MSSLHIKSNHITPSVLCFCSGWAIEEWRHSQSYTSHVLLLKLCFQEQRKVNWGGSHVTSPLEISLFSSAQMAVLRNSFSICIVLRSITLATVASLIAEIQKENCSSWPGNATNWGFFHVASLLEISLFLCA